MLGDVGLQPTKSIEIVSSEKTRQGVSFLFVGRIDPVECIFVSQQRNGNVRNVKPPAMRVRDVCFYGKANKFARTYEVDV